MNMGTTGGYDPRRMKKPMLPQDVGQALVMKNQPPQPGGMDPMGGGMPPGPGMMDPAAMGAAPGGMDPQAAPPGAGMMPPSAIDTMEPFDPATEHSASASRVALAEGIQRAMGVRAPANPRTRPAYNRTQLAQLGLPPAEIDLLDMNDPRG